MRTPTPGLCAWCGEPLIGSVRSTRKYCDATCRHAFHADAEKAKAVAPTRKVCSCNGSHIAGYNEDGDPTCQKCGAPIQGGQRSQGDALDCIASLMDVPLQAVRREARAPWPSSHATGHVTTVRVYKGKPFDPDAAVEVVPAATFPELRNGRRK